MNLTEGHSTYTGARVKERKCETLPNLKYLVTGLRTVPYVTVQYRILTLVPVVPYGTENVRVNIPHTINGQYAWIPSIKPTSFKMF